MTGVEPDSAAAEPAAGASADAELSLPAASLGAYAPADLAFAAAAWPMRAAEELRSALIYRALARALGSISETCPDGQSV
jgi:hypothetical protein